MYFGAKFFFGFSNSKFIDDNSFNLKDKRSVIGTLKIKVFKDLVYVGRSVKIMFKTLEI